MASEKSAERSARESGRLTASTRSARWRRSSLIGSGRRSAARGLFLRRPGRLEVILSQGLSWLGDDGHHLTCPECCLSLLHNVPHRLSPGGTKKECPLGGVGTRSLLWTWDDELCRPFAWSPVRGGRQQPDCGRDHAGEVRPSQGEPDRGGGQDDSPKHSSAATLSARSLLATSLPCKHAGATLPPASWARVPVRH